jgi:hypothetical protein
LKSATSPPASANRVRPNRAADLLKSKLKTRSSLS